MAQADLNAIPVRDLADPRLEPYRNQTDAWLRARHNPDRIDDQPDALTAGGLFMAEGSLVVAQLGRSRFEAVSALVTPRRLEADAPALASLGPGVPIFVAEPALMDEIAGFHVHRGILACGRRGTPLTPDEALAGARVCVVMEDLANHDNVGGIFRSVAALVGPSGAVLYSERTCDPLYRKALRVSMGQVLRVPFTEVPDGDAGGLDRLRERGWLTLALTPGAEARSLWSGGLGARLAAADRVALVVGAEGPGLSEATLARCDERVAIPVDPMVDSLNVTVAASLALGEIARLRARSAGA